MLLVFILSKVSVRSTHIKSLPVFFVMLLRALCIFYYSVFFSAHGMKSLSDFRARKKVFLSYELVYFLYETRACQIWLLESPGELWKHARLPRPQARHTHQNLQVRKDPCDTDNSPCFIHSASDKHLVNSTCSHFALTSRKLVL